MELYDNKPNFSIFLPGPCNAECEFCYNNNKVKCRAVGLTSWIKNLTDIIHKLPLEFRSVSITGYEPSISRYLIPTLSLLDKFKYNFDKVVLTTNGTGLTASLRYRQNRYLIEKVVTDINISRHHYDELKNQKIFGGTYSIFDRDITNIARFFGAYKITLQCLYNPDEDPLWFANNYIKAANDMGIQKVCFRIPAGKLSIPHVAWELHDDTHPEDIRTQLYHSYSYMINGTKIQWKSTVDDPATILSINNDDRIFELVYAPDGWLYSGWDFGNERQMLIL